jgi:hypothetical protein
MSDRSKGLLVHRLDSEKLLELGLNILRLQYGDLDQTASVEPLVLVKTKDQSVWSVDPQPRLAVICGEGVGWQEDEKNGLVTFWVDFGHYGSHALAVKVHPRVIEACVTDETVDLADFIRTFGARLDSNFYTWKSAIGQTEQSFKQEVLA